MRIIVLDNDDFWLDKIKSYLIKLQFELNLDYQVILCHHYEEIYDYDDIQLFILDIHLQNEKTINKYNEIINKYPDSIIVYLTSYMEYMPQAFGIQVYKYILKEHIEDLKDVIFFTYKYYDKDGLIFKTTEGDMFYRYNQIYSIESQNKKIYLYTKDDEIRLYNQGINNILKMLPSQFVLINKQVIINLDKVTFFSKEKIILADHKDSFVISRRKYNHVYKKYIERCMRK